VVPTPQVWETENPVIQTLVDSKGNVLIEVRERPLRIFGFRIEDSHNA